MSFLALHTGVSNHLKLLFLFVFRDPKDLVETRERLESLVREAKRDTEVSLVCRGSLDPR